MSYHLFQGTVGKHVYDRFLIVSCEHIVPEEERDPQLLDKLLAEKDIIASVAIQYLKKAIDRDYKFTESQRTIKNREDYMIKNDSLKLFLQECCVIGEGRVVTSVFKEKYKNWCKDNKLEPEPANNINSILTQEYGVVKGKSNRDFYEITIKE